MIYFVSDIHLGGGDEESARQTERRFAAWLDRVGADAEAIVLAGDLFDFWFEYRRVVPKGFVRTLGRLAALTDRGVRVLFFTGNHDMWVRDYLTRECGIEVHTRPELLRFGERRIFVAHGDDMSIRHDPLLKLLNRIFRSRLLRRLFAALLHPDAAMRFGHWWSGRSRKAHDTAGAPDAATTEPLIEYARSYAAEHDVDHFVFGHMHFSRDFRDGTLHTVHLGGWDREPSYAVLDDAGLLTLKPIDA